MNKPDDKTCTWYYVQAYINAIAADKAKFEMDHLPKEAADNSEEQKRYQEASKEYDEFVHEAHALLDKYEQCKNRMK